MKSFLAVFVLGISLASFAWGAPLGFGVLAGGNMSNLVYSTQGSGYKTDILLGFTGGAFVEVPLTDSLALQPEAEFSMEGNQANITNIMVTGPGVPPYTSTNTAYTYSFNYLEMPLLLKAHTPLAPSLVGSLFIGPAAGFLLSANEHYSLTYNNLSGNYALNGAGLEWGALFGVGLEIDKVLLDLRYDLGLTSVYQDGFGAANSVLTFQLGYRLQ